MGGGKGDEWDEEAWDDKGRDRYLRRWRLTSHLPSRARRVRVFFPKCTTLPHLLSVRHRAPRMPISLPRKPVAYNCSCRAIERPTDPPTVATNAYACCCVTPGTPVVLASV
jgi:hypothetical protein